MPDYFDDKNEGEIPALGPHTEMDNPELKKQLNEALNIWVDSVSKKVRQLTKERPINSSLLVNWVSVLDNLVQAQIDLGDV